MERTDLHVTPLTRQAREAMRDIVILPRGRGYVRQYRHYRLRTIGERLRAACHLDFCPVVPTRATHPKRCRNRPGP